MKTLVAIVLALGVGFAAAYVIVSRQKDAQLEQLKAQPPVTVFAPAPAPVPVEKIVMISAPAPAVESPEDILDDLLNVKLDADGSRNSALRMVVFKLETLKQRGASAVPAIRSFLGRNVDVDYNQQSNNNSDNSANQTTASGVGGGRGLNRGISGGLFGGARSVARRARNLQTLQTDWVVPPSLRLGLVGTLKEIGGAEGEQALAEMLNSTGRGVEIAYLTVILEEIAPGKYQNIAITAAKELLMNPPAIDNPDRLDDLSKSYLYGVLEFYKDTSFVVNAQQMLVGADGRLDQDVMDYLTTVLNDQAVSAFYAAYQNPALTNEIDRMLIRGDVLAYVGQNSQANALLTETLDNPDVNPRIKAMTLIGLAIGENDPQEASAKIALLTSLQNRFANDPTLSQVIPSVIVSLQTGDPVNVPNIFGGGRRDGVGGNNNGNDGNNGAGAIMP
jgi:hypothetical protein